MNNIFSKFDGSKLNGVYEKDGVIFQKQYSFYDTVLNVSSGCLEVLKFDDPFRVAKSYALDEEFVSDYRTNCVFAEALTAQKWKSVNGVAVAADSSARIADLIQSRRVSARKSIARFYNYALGDNKWQYFCTWTFSDNKVRNDKDLLYDTYNNFIKVLRKGNPDLKALATYEEFEKGGYHMHALFGNCVLRLKPAINPNTGEFIYSEFNNQIFNCIDWQYGFSTVVCIIPTSEKQQIVNYLSKYLTKKCPAPYRCKRFFHTQNLDCRDSYMLNTLDYNDPVVRMLSAKSGTSVDSANIFEEFCKIFGLEQVKERKNGVTVYRSKIQIRGFFDNFDCVTSKNSK